MNKKAKIIIAALILIFLGLIIYAFAAPKDDEDELDNRVQQVEKDKDTSKDTEKESEEESTKKEETNKEATPTDEKEKTEEQKSTEEEPEAVNESYAQALALVEKAENSLSEEDVAAAKEAIANVVDADTTELEERIEAVESDILARTLVETLKTMVDEAEEQTDIEEARNYNNDNEVANAVENVNNEELKAVLEETYAEAKNVLEDTTKPEIVGAPENGITNENVSLTIDDDTEVTIALTKDGEQVDPTLEISGDGEYVVTVTDEAFNVTEITFIIDTVAPGVTVSYSETNPTNAEWVEVSLTADEKVQAVDGYTLSTGDTILSKLIYNNNETPVKVVVTDLAGNTTEVEYQVTNLDRENPVITLPGVQGASAMEYRVESGTEVTVEDIMATVTDDVDPDTTIAPYKADLLIGTKEENIYNYDFSNGFNTRYIGRYNIYYTYTDAVGNKVDATLLLIMTDTTDPVITIPGTAGRNQNELHVKENQLVSLEDIMATVTDNVDPETKILPVKADLLVSNVASENTYNYDLNQGIKTDKIGRYNLTYAYTDKAGHRVEKGMMLIIDEFVTVEQTTENQQVISISPFVIASDVITTIEFKEEVKLVSVTALDETDAADTVDTTKITNNTGEEFGTKYTITAPSIVTGTSTNWDHATLLFENKNGAQYEISNCDDGNANIVVPMVVAE